MEIAAVLEEVALEGLDGITLNALWLRLEDRPGFHFDHEDNYVKQYAWKHLCQSRDIEFFQLKEPRPELVIDDFEKYVHENRCVIPDDYPPDIYSFKIIEKDGVIGCCDTFESRVPITREIRSEDGFALMTVEDVQKKFGQQLALVACQKLRFQALLQTNFRPSGINAEVYSVLERIGRSRYIGEPTKIPNRTGLTSEIVTSSHLFMLVKYLCKRGYAIKQPLNIAMEGSGKYMHVRLIHLRRFYRRSSGNAISYLNTICTFLLSQPNRMATTDALVERFGFKMKDMKYVGFNKDFLSVESVPYRTVYPDAAIEDYSCKADQEKEKTLKVIRLLDHFKIDDANDDDEKDEEEQDDDPESGRRPIDKLSGDGILYDKSALSTVKFLIEQSGARGMTEMQVRDQLHIYPKTMETIVKTLVKSGDIAKKVLTHSTVRIILLMSPAAYAEVESMKTEKEMSSVENESQAELSISQDSILEDVTTEAHDEFGDIGGSKFGSVDTMLQRWNISWVIVKQQTPSKEPSGMPDKKKERRDYILRQLAHKKVFKEQALLLNAIIEVEKNQGLKETICRKSLKRLLSDLYEEGKVNHLKMTWGKPPNVKTEQFVCCASLKDDDPIVKEALVSNYMFTSKFLNMRVKQGDKMKKAREEVKPVIQPVSVCDMLQGLDPSAAEIKESKLKSPPKAHSLTNFRKFSKAEKAKTLHEVMFYLLYDYQGDQTADDAVAMNEERKEAPVFLDVDDWRRHVPPLKIHNVGLMTKMVPGACMMGDILIAMPICIFSKLIYVSWEVRGLKELLDDGDKQLYPLKYLPKEMLSDLFHSRGYLSKLNETLRFLCSLGLLSYGPKAPCRNLEYIILYLHKKAMVLDTTSSLKGNVMTRSPDDEEFLKVTFTFDNLKKVQRFWNEVYRICQASKLGNKQIEDVKGNNGQVNLLDAQKPRKFSNIREDDWLPGDQRGAAGFDSSLYMHLYKSWHSKMMRLEKEKKTGAVVTPPVNKARARQIKAVKIREKPPKEPKIRLKKEPKPKKVKRHQSDVREETKQKHAKQVLDDEDKKAMKEMVTIRSRFNPLENGVILITHVASLLLNPGRPAIDLPYKEIRLRMRDYLPNAFKDKTQFAIRSRSLRLTKHENFFNHVAFYLAKARYDKELQEKCKTLLSDPGLSTPARITQLVIDLFNKFRSPDTSLSIRWPSSVEELYDNYIVIKIANIMGRKQASVDLGCQSKMEIQSYLLWNLLLGWIYNKRLVSNYDMYCAFCKFPGEVMATTYNSLKSTHIVIKKLSYGDVERPCLGATQIHQIFLSQRHKFEMKSTIPMGVFDNAVKQVQALEDSFRSKQSEAWSSLGKQDGEQSGMDVSQTGRDVSQPGPSWADPDSGPSVVQGQGEGSERGKEASPEMDEGYTRLKWTQYQGGCVMSLISLFALDMVKLKVFIPDFMLRMSQTGMERYPVKKSDGKRTAKEMEEVAIESNEEDTRPPLKKKKSDVYQTSNDNKFQGREQESGPSTSDSVVNGKNTTTGSSTLKRVSQGNSQVTFSCFQGMSDSLRNFTIRDASNTLLTLARTPNFESLDLARSFSPSPGTFKIEPLKMDFALKEEMSDFLGRGEPTTDKGHVVVDSERGAKSGEGSDPGDLKVDSSKKVDTLKEKFMDTSSTSTTTGHPCKEKGGTRRSCYAARFKDDRYTKIISRLEQSFPLDFAKTDVVQELRSHVPSHLVDEAEQVYQLIDSYGSSGATELELERAKGVPLNSLTSTIKFLCDMDASKCQREQVSMEIRFISLQSNISGV